MTAATSARGCEASAKLHSKVQAAMDAGVLSPAHFDELALEIAGFQSRDNPVVKRLWQNRGLAIGGLRQASELPAVPSDVFRFARVACHGPSEDVACFQTSGTTSGARGKHFFRELSTYRKGALLFGRAMLQPPKRRLEVHQLVARPDLHSDSSLGYMCAEFGREWGAKTYWHVGEDKLPLGRAAAELAAASGPVLLVATSFALVHLLDELEGRPLPLPAGSVVMQTGGTKGKSREVSAEELRLQCARVFALPASQITSEYGMTELSSQAYLDRAADPSAHRYVTPHWLRVQAADPQRLTPLPPGEVGIARLTDLANVDSAAVIQTQDLVRCDEAGGFQLLGRASGARARGCSLRMEELLAKTGAAG